MKATALSHSEPPMVVATPTVVAHGISFKQLILLLLVFTCCLAVLIAGSAFWFGATLSAPPTELQHQPKQTELKKPNTTEPATAKDQKAVPVPPAQQPAPQIPASVELEVQLQAGEPKVLKAIKSGVITQVLIKEGETLETGQVVFELVRERDYRRLRKAEAKYQDLRAKAKKNDVYADFAEAARVELRATAAQARKSKVTAGFSGQVQRIWVKNGHRIKSDETLLEIKDTTKLFSEALLIPNLGADLSCTIENAEAACTIRRLPGDQQDFVRVQLELDNRAGKIAENASVKVKLQRATTQ